MVYHISYHFYSDNAPDESFFEMLDDISGGCIQLGFDGSLLIDVALEAKGLEDYLSPFFPHELDRYIILPFVRKKSRCKVSKKEQEFIKNHWDNVPK